MEFMFKVSDKLIKETISSILNDRLYQDAAYDATTLKKAKVPSRTKVMAEVMADDKFAPALQKRLSWHLDDVVNDNIHYIIGYILADDTEVLNTYEDACDKVLQEQRKQEAQEDEIKRYTEILTNAGYQVTKKA